MGPAAVPALRPAPLPRLSRTAGLSIQFPLRLGQRGIAHLRARPPYQPRRQIELAERHVLHAVGARQRRRDVTEHRPEGAGGRREAERAAGLGVHVRHRERRVGRGEPVEPEAGALGSSFLISTWLRSQPPARMLEALSHPSISSSQCFHN